MTSSAGWAVKDNSIPCWAVRGSTTTSGLTHIQIFLLEMLCLTVKVLKNPFQLWAERLSCRWDMKEADCAPQNWAFIDDWLPRKHCGKGTGAENTAPSLVFSAACLPREGPSLPAVNPSRLITSAVCRTLWQDHPDVTALLLCSGSCCGRGRY